MASSAPLSSVTKKHLAIVILAFILSRGLALCAGLRYLDNESAWLVQLLDLDLLHHHLARVLLHLHGQPPLFNLLVGLSLKIGGQSFGSVMLGIQFGLDLSAGIAVYLTLITLDVAPLFSLIVSLLLTLNPAAILFDFDALYTTIVYAFNCFIALAATRFIRSRSNRSLYWLVAMTVLLTLLRSSYHWLWLAVMFCLLWWQLPASRRRIAKAGVLALFLALLWPAKNAILFHHFASSTWGPRNIARVLSASQLVQDRSPELHALEPADFTQEQPWFRQHWLVPPVGYPELDDIAKGGNGATNWNSLTLLRVHDAEAKDDLYILRHDPGAYLRTVRAGMRLYFQPATDYFHLNPDLGFWRRGIAQYQTVSPFDRTVRRVCCNIFGLQQPVDEAADKRELIPWSIKGLCAGAVLMYVFLAACAFTIAFQPSLWKANPERRVALILMLYTLLYTFLVVNFFDVGENMRYRFETQALAMIVCAAFAQVLWQRRKVYAAAHGGVHC
jgi:hypothetical protein